MLSKDQAFTVRMQVEKSWCSTNFQLVCKASPKDPCPIFVDLRSGACSSLINKYLYCVIPYYLSRCKHILLGELASAQYLLFAHDAKVVR